MNSAPRLGKEILHPGDLEKPEDLRTWLNPPDRSCRCVGVGAEYAERGLFRVCACVVKPDAPDHVKTYLEWYKFLLF
jgi:hypothetical protein